MVEKGRRVGGVSVHTGTIPSKTLRETVLNLSGWRERGFYGRSYRVKQDIGAVDLIARLQKTLDHEVEVLEHQFSRNAVKTACGEARFVGPNQIEITADGGEIRVVSAAHILIACGTRPFRPDYVPFDNKTVFDSDEIIDLPKLPRSLAVIGAGVIGVEYATIFSRARRRGDADRAAADLPRLHRQGADRGIHARTARPQRRAAARLRRQIDRAQRERQHRHQAVRRPQRRLPKCCCSPPAGSAPPTG